MSNFIKKMEKERNTFLSMPTIVSRPIEEKKKVKEI